MNLQVTIPKNWKPYKRKSFFNWWIDKVKDDYISHEAYENILDKFNQ